MSSYYWAGGEQVPLEEDQRLAVDVAAAEEAGMWTGELADAAGSGVEVGSGMVLVEGAELSDGLRGRLDEAGAGQPVYRQADRTLVVLPEVRVEAGDERTAGAVRSAVASWAGDVDVAEPKPGSFVLTPASHRGADALELANHVAETVGPDAAQARFLRISTEKE